MTVNYNSARSNRFKIAKKRNNLRNDQHNYIDDFIEFAKQTNAKAVLVLNPKIIMIMISY